MALPFAAVKGSREKAGGDGAAPCDDCVFFMG